MSEQFDDFVPDPSLANALLADLGRPRVARSERWALLGVAGHAVVRSSWTDEVELSTGAFARMLSEPEPTPPEAFEIWSFRKLGEASRTATASRCGGCFLEAGRNLCVVCDGDGKVGLNDGKEACDTCSGRGSLTCTTCDGSGMSVRVALEFGEDRATPFAHVFVPDGSYALGVALSRFLGSRSSVPECLRFELGDEHTHVDPYRGRQGDDQYRGHRLGQALGRARHYVERMARAPSVTSLRHQASVWPLALLELENGFPAALVLDEGREARVVLPGA